MTATSLAKAGPAEAGPLDFDLREAREWRLEVLWRGMNFPEVKMKVLLYGEREGFTSGGNGGIGGVVRRRRDVTLERKKVHPLPIWARSQQTQRMGHPHGQLGVGLAEIAPTTPLGISVARKAGRKWVTPRQ
jgi:hypothetical protein